jgi:hypothetical protein
MKPASLASAILACALLAAFAAHAADLAGARAFLVRLYAHYPLKEGAAFEPTGRSAPSVFDPALVALFREDVRLTPPGDVGAIDSDPICDCQDDDGMSVRIEPVRATGAGRATARVDLRFGEASPPETSRLDIDLIAVGDGWRIHDIRSKTMPSLGAYLTRSVLAEKHH